MYGPIPELAAKQKAVRGLLKLLRHLLLPIRQSYVSVRQSRDVTRAYFALRCVNRLQPSASSVYLLPNTEKIYRD